MDTRTNPKSIKVLATPGFLRRAEEFGAGRDLTAEPIKILTEALTKTPPEPSWVVVDPDLSKPQEEDEGRTRKLPGPFRFWAIRDDHPNPCDCGCGGQSLITFILAEEY
jgi:hypothetical protein